MEVKTKADIQKDEWLTEYDDFSATVYINNLHFNVSGDYEDIDEGQYVDFEKKVRAALKEVIDEYGGSYSETYLER